MTNSLKLGQSSSNVAEEAHDEKPPVDFNSLIVQCSDCDYTATVERANSGMDDFYSNEGSIVRFGADTTHQRLNSISLCCECCQDDRDDLEY